MCCIIILTEKLSVKFFGNILRREGTAPEGKILSGHRLVFMIVLTGKGVCSGIAVGVISYFGSSAPEVKFRNISDADAELERVKIAKQSAEKEITELYKKALPELGKENAEIFEMQRELMNDIDYNNAIKNIITSQKVNAEFAVAVASDNFSAMLSAMSDDYLRAR